MSPSDVNYNRQYYQNTFISTTRAMSDYLLKPRYVNLTYNCVAESIVIRDLYIRA